MSLTPEQVQIVRSTVPVLQEHGNDITALFYSTLLNEIPALNNVFNQANQANNHQSAALAGALYAYASHIDDLGALSPAVERICHKHASLFVQPEHYKVVGEYLLRAMGDVFGSALTPEILDAWGAAYWQLANLMIKREEQLLEGADGWTDWRDFKITEKVKESDEITSFYLSPADRKKLPGFLPGQYISVMTDVPELQYLQPRQYSLSDAPNPEYYRISVKKDAGLDLSDPEATVHPGYVSNILHDEKQVGDTLKVSRPAGQFFLHPEHDKDKPIVLLSAGVGITPMISILNTVSRHSPDQRISFIHGNRNSNTRAFHQHVKNVVSQHLNKTLVTFIKTPDPERDVSGRDYHHTGRLNLSNLDRAKGLCLDSDKTLYFVCGPESFMADVENGLTTIGVEKDRIRLEVFGTGGIPRK